MNLTDQEFTTLTTTKSEWEWNNACDAVKKARNGQYPNDWFIKILASGVMATTQLNWK